MHRLVTTPGAITPRVITDTVKQRVATATRKRQILMDDSADDRYNVSRDRTVFDLRCSNKTRSVSTGRKGVLTWTIFLWKINMLDYCLFGFDVAF